MPICNKGYIAIITLLIAGLFISCSSEKDYLTKEKAVLSAYVDSTVEMKLHKVSERVYYVRGIPGIATDNEGFISNAGFVVTSEGVVVYDALGTPSLAKKFIQIFAQSQINRLKLWWSGIIMLIIFMVFRCSKKLVLRSLLLLVMKNT